ncbi:hypothetical protein LMG22931_06832 [Paraburkholderia nemoris]|jgi:hypothetical protein|nr:hypothetical protein LMG22931_06832 [Paraburkholderia nemoris]
MAVCFSLNPVHGMKSVAVETRPVRSAAQRFNTDAIVADLNGLVERPKVATCLRL